VREADSSKQASNVPPQVWLKVTIGGREVPWLTRMAELLVLPFIRWRAGRRQRLWKPQLDRINSALEAELPGGRSHPELHDRVAEQFAPWLDKNPESAP
jgi:hypothetical protein